MAEPVPDPAINLPINLLAKFEKFTDYWQPRMVAELNDYQVKLARINGEFIWHDVAWSIPVLSKATAPPPATAGSEPG